MDESRISAWLRELEELEWEALSEEELAMVSGYLHRVKGRVDFLVAEASATRAERYWRQIPSEEARTIRLLLKGARLTPAVLQGVPELYPLLLLIDIQDPQVVQLWANLSPEDRAQRIEDLRRALSLTEVRRTTSVWENESESQVLAYEVLGLTQAATWDEVRKRYRELVAQHHPDRGGDAGLFRAIHKAYKLVEARFL
jgi:hypothetical protein